jgi:hypothetical protein
MEYVPYNKWFGTAFSELRLSKDLRPIFDKLLSVKSTIEREALVSEAYKILARKHNPLKITRHLRAKVYQFHNRPYLVIHGEVFSDEIRG